VRILRDFVRERKRKGTTPLYATGSSRKASLGSAGSFAWKAQAFRPRDTARAMSEKNVETVRRVYEGVNARLEAPRELFDPDYEFDNTELWPDVVEVLGFDAAQEAMREYWETFEAYHVEIEEVIYADEGRVVDVVRDGGRMRGTDAEVWNRFFHVWTLRDGRIVRLSIHTDRTRSLEAAGLSE
jgi:ketosteroid isomerase-like protein